jgi:hypothetical protein
MKEIRRLIVQMAEDNPSWGSARIQGALKHLDHRVARSTIAKTLKEHGIKPSPERPMSWATFVRSHAHLIAAADLFTTEAWTARGLVTHYTLVVIDIATLQVDPEQFWCRNLADRLPGTEHECVRRAIHPVDQVRVYRPDDFPWSEVTRPCDPRVRGALP